jgi:hypothetical protein
MMFSSANIASPDCRDGRGHARTAIANYSIASDPELGRPSLFTDHQRAAAGGGGRMRPVK